MKLQGDYNYQAPIEVVWRALLDPEVLAKTLPGCEKLEAVGENKYSGALKAKVGPVQGVFNGGVELLNLSELSGYDLKIEGQGPGGFMNGTGRVDLEKISDEETKLTYAIDAQVGGRIASIGQRLVESSAKMISRQGLKGLEEQIAELMKPTEEEQPVAAEVIETEVTEAVPSKPPTAAPQRPSLALIGITVVLIALAAIAVALRACT